MLMISPSGASLPLVAAMFKLAAGSGIRRQRVWYSKHVAIAGSGGTHSKTYFMVPAAPPWPHIIGLAVGGTYPIRHKRHVEGSGHPFIENYKMEGLRRISTLPLAHRQG